MGFNGTCYSQCLLHAFEPLFISRVFQQNRVIGGRRGGLLGTAAYPRSAKFLSWSGRGGVHYIPTTIAGHDLSGKRVLDIGSGLGRRVIVLARDVPDLEFRILRVSRISGTFGSCPRCPYTPKFYRPTTRLG